MESACDQETEDNKIEKATKEQKYKYKTKEAAGLGKAVSLLLWSTSRKLSTSENQIEKVTKEQREVQDQGGCRLDQAVSKLSSDKEGVETKLAAVFGVFGVPLFRSSVLQPH